MNHALFATQEDVRGYAALSDRGVGVLAESKIAKTMGWTADELRVRHQRSIYFKEQVLPAVVAGKASLVHGRGPARCEAGRCEGGK